LQAFTKSRRRLSALGSVVKTTSRAVKPKSLCRFVVMNFLSFQGEICGGIKNKTPGLILSG
jgi:hypothetical protein